MVPVPEKLYFKIGEVAQIVGVKPHVLRYWESEFPSVKPVKSQGKQRLYRKNHIQQLLKIKELLHDKGYTLSGAKKQLKSAGADEMPLFPPAPSPLEEIRNELRRLRRSLE